MSLRRIIISGVWVSVGVLLGRVAGFFREVMIAKTYGVSAEADVTIFVLTVPDFLVNMLVAGGVSAALIPEFKRCSQAELSGVFVQSSVLFGLFFAAVAFVLVFFSGNIVGAFAPGFNFEARQMASDMLGVVLWLIPLTVLAGVSTACLQSLDKFAIPAMGTLIFNVSLLLGLYFVSSVHDLGGFVWFVILGGLIRWLSQLWALRGYIFLDRLRLGWFLSWELFHRYYQAVIALGLLTMFPVIVRAFSTMHGEGGLSTANYALRLIEFPLAALITVFAVILFPRLSSCFEACDESGFAALLREGVYWSVIFAAAITGAMFVAAESYVGFVFDWGTMSEGELFQISLLMMIGVFSLPLQALSIMLIAAFNARKDMKPPMYVSFVGLLFLVGSSWFAEEVYGIKGVFYALVLSYFVVTLGLVLMLVLRVRSKFLNIIGIVYSLVWPVTLVCLITAFGMLFVNFYNAGSVITLFSSILFALFSVLCVSLVSSRYRCVMLAWFK